MPKRRNTRRNPVADDPVVAEEPQQDRPAQRVRTEHGDSGDSGRSGARPPAAPSASTDEGTAHALMMAFKIKKEVQATASYVQLPVKAMFENAPALNGRLEMLAPLEEPVVQGIGAMRALLATSLTTEQKQLAQSAFASQSKIAALVTIAGTSLKAGLRTARKAEGAQAYLQDALQRVERGDADVMPGGKHYGAIIKESLSHATSMAGEAKGDGPKGDRPNNNHNSNNNGHNNKGGFKQGGGWASHGAPRSGDRDRERGYDRDRDYRR
jgi:hypothetical protein